MKPRKYSTPARGELQPNQSLHLTRPSGDRRLTFLVDDRGGVVLVRDPLAATVYSCPGSLSITNASRIATKS
jgi:hypothetical protein